MKNFYKEIHESMVDIAFNNPPMKGIEMVYYIDKLTTELFWDSNDFKISRESILDEFNSVSDRRYRKSINGTSFVIQFYNKQYQ